MNWLKAVTSKTPTVPSDKAQRDLEYQKSLEQLRHAQELGARIYPMEDAIRRRNEKNHYAEGLAIAYARR